MVSIKFNVLLANPLNTLKILFVGSWRSIIILLARIILPFRSRKLTLRNAIARAWVITSFYSNPDIWCSEPGGHKCQEVVFPGSTAAAKREVGGWVIPTTEVAELKNKSAIILFAHGGGYEIGHGLQNLSDFQRYLGKARRMGQDMAVLTVKYPLSTVKRWPAQRDAFIRMYEWLLDQGVPAAKIVFSGTSAGGSLILSSMLYIRDRTSLPQPRCAVAHSAWTDATGRLTGIENHPLLETDYLCWYPQMFKGTNDRVRPEELPFDTPEISPVHDKDLSRLPPQLIFYSDAEILRTDSTRWIARSRDAGVRIHEHVGKGELHTFSDGGPLTQKRVIDECDDIMLTYIVTELAPPL